MYGEYTRLVSEFKGLMIRDEISNANLWVVAYQSLINFMLESDWDWRP